MENLDLQREKFDEYRVEVNDSRYRKAMKILKKINPGKLLEIGCSGGEFLELLKKQGWDVSGLEISEKAAERARKKAIDVKTGDANKKLPFEENSFNVVLAGEIIEHTFSDSKFLDECYRILKEKGILIITTPNLLSLKNRILMLLGFNPRFSLAKYHYHAYTPNIIKQLFKNSKFKNFKVIGNYIIYSKNREKISGSLFEYLGEIFPSLAEHFIIIARR